jgi:hypothetical protein
MIFHARESPMTKACEQAQSFLAGEGLTFEVADKLWQELEGLDELSLARVTKAFTPGRGKLLFELQEGSKVTA